MSPSALEEVIYFASYVVTEPGDTPLEKKQFLSEKEYRAYREKYGNKFQAAMGAEALKNFFKILILNKEVECIKRRIENSTRTTSYTCN